MMDVSLIRPRIKVQAVRSQGQWETDGKVSKVDKNGGRIVHVWVKFGRETVRVLPTEVRLPIAFEDLAGK